MTIVELLAKVKKGEALTAEEKAYLEGYDHQKELDSAAAAARKKAEADAAKAAKDAETAAGQLKELQAKLDEASNKGKTDLQKMQEQLTALTQQVKAAEAEKAKLVRQQKLDDVIRGSGVEFVKEVDGAIMRRALEAEFGGIPDDDLANGEKVNPVLATFKARNKAVIVDKSGHGSGGASHDGTGGEVGKSGKPVEQMTPAERRADLKAKGII